MRRKSFGAISRHNSNLFQKSSKPADEELEDESEDDSDWDGISDEEENAVQVVEHTEAQARTAAMSKEELKSFMVFAIPFSSGLC
jgi:hypothetical protein